MISVSSENRGVHRESLCPKKYSREATNGRHMLTCPPHLQNTPVLAFCCYYSQLSSQLQSCFFCIIGPNNFLLLKSGWYHISASSVDQGEAIWSIAFQHLQTMVCSLFCSLLISPKPDVERAFSYCAILTHHILVNYVASYYSKDP